MESKFHRWWLGSCFAALLLASWVGGFSLAVTSVFIVIYLTGVTLIGPDGATAEPVDVVAAQPVDVVAADPEWLTAHKSESDARGDAAPSADASGEDKAADEPATETAITPEDGESTPIAVETETPAAEVAEAAETETPDTEVPAPETPAAEAPAATDAEATEVDGEDDAVPYPEDFDDEVSAADIEECSPA